MTCPQTPRAGEPAAALDPRIARLKERLLTAPYEICMARARHFTESYRATEGLDPALRNAFALKRTLERQRIFIYPDEFLAGTKTEKYLAGPLSVERGDFLRTLQLEIDILEKKQRPFFIDEADRRLFWEEILPYWDGRTVRDYKAREWERRGLIDRRQDPVSWLKHRISGFRFLHYAGRENLKKTMGANLQAPLTWRRLRNLFALRYEFARNNPTPAVYCFDVQGHLSLGVDKVVRLGLAALVQQARERLAQLRRDEPRNVRGAAFLEAAIISLAAAIAYAERFAALAEELAGRATAPEEQRRLERLAAACRKVPRQPAETFAEALQAAWLAQVVAEIQYGTHDVFAPGRIDQFLLPCYRADLASGRLTREEAAALIQEYFLKLSANVEPIPEVGMETNAVLGNSQHCVMVGGLDRQGRDATNELSYLILDAYERIKGTVNQLCVRVHQGAPPEFLRRSVEVFRHANGIAIYNDEAIVRALAADGLSAEDARDYCIVGCVETSGQSNTHGCPGGHELVLPAVLWLALTNGQHPPPALGQQAGWASGDPRRWATFEQLFEAFHRQLNHQLGVLVQAVEGKDLAHREHLPAPFVSALMDDCLARARDLTDGGARHDFTSIDVRGLATVIDSLLALRASVYHRREFSLRQFVKILLDDFRGHEALRRRLLHEPAKYGTGSAAADQLTLQVLSWIHQEIASRRNLRGGRFRACYYSYGNHVIDGFLLGATPDGRKRGWPISNGVSPSNLIEQPRGPFGALKTVAQFPPEQVSSGVSLNLRFHPSMLKNDAGVDAFASMIRTYFQLGGMHLQPNVVSTETLREAQRDPARYRDLVVKVSGYSAYFCDLGRSIQEDIIARAEFGQP